MKKFEEFLDESNNALAEAENLLTAVLNIWGREYGKGKKYDETTVSLQVE